MGSFSDEFSIKIKLHSCALTIQLGEFNATLWFMQLVYTMDVYRAQMKTIW